LLTGIYNVAVLPHGRIALPKPVISALPSPPPGFYAARGFEGCIALYLPPAWARLVKFSEETTLTSSTARQFFRLLFANSSYVMADKAGRITLPPELLQISGIADEAVLLGVKDRLEIWPPGLWLSFQEEHGKRFDETADEFFARNK